MPRITGKSGKITVGGVEVGTMIEWAIDAKTDVVDATAFQDTWHQKLGTFLSWTGSCSGRWLGSANSFWTTFLTGAVGTVQFFPVAGATENFNGDAFLDFSIKVAKDGVVDFTCKVEGTGTLTHTP
jgi:hypothetical protein